VALALRCFCRGAADVVEFAVMLSVMGTAAVVEFTRTPGVEFSDAISVAFLDTLTVEFEFTRTPGVEFSDAITVAFLDSLPVVDFAGAVGRITGDRGIIFTAWASSPWSLPNNICCSSSELTLF